MFKNMEGIYTSIITLLIGLVLYHLVKFIYKRIEEKKHHKEVASSGIEDIDKMDGLQFEFYLKSLLNELGYKSLVTKGSNDFGADLVLTKNKKKIVIQAKRYKYKSNIGVDAVQQIYTAIPYYKAESGWIITNSHFTKNAKILADVCNVRLIGRKKLVQLINEVNPPVTPIEVKHTIPPKERNCPKCKSLLAVRHSKQGNEFFGCSNYPSCRHTEPVAN